MNRLLKKHFPTYYQVEPNQHGVVFITALVSGLLLTFIGLSLASAAIIQLRRTSDNVFVSNSFMSAEAGIERSLYELNNDNDFSGYTEEIEFFNTDQQGRGTYQTSIETGANNERTLTSTGKVYSTNGILQSERKIKVSLVGTASNAPSVYAGPGGLELGGSARVGNTDVHVNGKVSLKGASSIGSDTKPVNLSVANIACPTGSNPGPTYPSLCTTTQPITIQDWGSSSIIGTICATGQTQTKFPESVNNHNPPQIRAGSGGGDGLVPGCVAPPVSMPTYNKAEQISRITTTASPSNINYDCSSWKTGDGFVRTWPADLKLTGNVNLGSSCDLTITGDVYITGDLTIGGAATIKVANSVGTRVPTIIVDGKIDAGGGGKILANSSGTSMRLISYKSFNNCNPCTGTDLKKSTDMVNINVNGGGQYPGAIFQAYWSTIDIDGSGLVGSAIGQKVDMNGAGNLTFGTSLASGTTTWTIRSYQYDYE